MNLFFPIILAFSFALPVQEGLDISLDSEVKITEHINAVGDSYNSPGIAVVITNSDSILYWHYYGISEPGDRYLIGSCSKSFTSLLILVLQEKGLLNINDPVAHHLNWFRYEDESVSNRITIKNLLNHTSGISEKKGLTFFQDNTLDYTNYYSEILREIDVPDLEEQPYQYSNVNFNLAGLIIEKVTQKPYAQNLKELITTPLGMSNTNAFDSTTTLIDSYQYFMQFPVIKKKPFVHYQEVPSGGIVSSANDMAVYLRALLNAYKKLPKDSILNNNLTDQLFKPNTNNPANYGLGWRIRNYDGLETLIHSGQNQSFETEMMIVPSLDRGIVVLINSIDSPVSEVWKGILRILDNKEPGSVNGLPLSIYLPLLPMVLFIYLIYQVVLWMKDGSLRTISKKFIPNLILSVIWMGGTILLTLLPGLFDVTYRVAFDFSPVLTSVLVSSIVLIMAISLVIYFRRTINSLNIVHE